MENSEKKKVSSNTNVVNEEINYSELIDIGRKFVNSDDIKLGLHYLTLALLSPNIDSSSKIQALAIKSYANYKLKDEEMTLYILSKVIHILNKSKLDSLDNATLLCCVRMLYRGGSVLVDSKQLYIAAYSFYYAKKLFDQKCMRGERDALDTLDKTLKPLLTDIGSQNIILKEKFNVEDNNEKKEEIQKMFLRLKKLFFEDEKDKLENEEKKSQEGERFFLISAVWVKNLVFFIKKFEKYQNSEMYMDHLDKTFNRSNILNVYFSDDGSHDLSHYGIYPAEINNFFIMKFKDYWHDHDEQESHTNIYIKKGIKEDQDFFFVGEDDWNFIKTNFQANFEIERKSVYLNDNLVIEVNLRKLKILVLNTELREKSIDLIKPRSIQISKALKVKDLKEKIQRCLGEQKIDFKEEKGGDIKIYWYNFGMKEHKKETFEMVYAFKNKFDSHKIVAEEITDDELAIDSLKFGPGDLLIVEVDTNFIEIIQEQKNCNLCNTIVEKIYRCSNCSTFVYCSEDCSKKDTQHIQYHINVNKLYKKKFNMQELAEINISELMDRNSRHGLVGLKNLGNTCFMNSALQCLSSCEELTKYFLTRKVFDEINKNNSHGTGGEVAKAYYELIKELWQGDSPYLCPTDFRQIFVRFVRQFAGFTQHDSQEMLTFMLDALHEDSNRVKSKPYVEMMEKSDKESESEASQRWWKNHLSRENSIIVDLFQGQYKSVITCPECNRISITYDPFMYLGLPIPSGHYKIKFKFFPYQNESSVKSYIYEYELPINDHSTVKNMKTKILSATKNNFNYDFLEAVCLTKEKIFRKIIKEDEFIFNYFDNGNEIIIYEKYPNICKENETDNYVTFYLFPTEYIEERSMIFMKKYYHKILSYPILISLHKNNTLRDLYFYIYKALRKILNINDKKFSLKNYLESSANKNTEYIEEEFKYVFAKMEDSLPFKMHIINNVPESTGFFSSKNNCEFCGTKCEYCSMVKVGGLTLKTLIKNISSMQNVSRPFLLYVEILKMEKNCSLYDNLDFPLNSVSKNLITKQSSINIYDCINLFRSEERLEKENAWYCVNCKNHQEAFKRLEIYKPPNYLIVQFKRFKIRSHGAVMGMIANKKNDVLIEYPVEELDLREYVVGTDKEDAIYDLCGISQHFGGLSSGHYTALCKNMGRWYEFDDERVLKASTSDVVNSAAYMLFYRKRSFNK